MEVLIFRTNVMLGEDVSKLGYALSSLPAVQHWNFDLDDCDRVLRIVGGGVCSQQIENILQKEGFVCVELED